MAKKFHLETLLSVTTGVMVCPSGDPKEFFDLLNYMTADTLDPHEIANAVKECRPSLFAQFPFLSSIDINEATPESFEEWLFSQVKLHGETFTVQPLPLGTHQVENNIFNHPKP
jgi:hypothetical protein